MFGRSSSHDPKSGDAPKPLPGAQPFPSAAPHSPQVGAAGAPATSTSVIGSDITIVGQKISIIAQTNILVDGDVRGDIDGRQVTIGSTGKVTGTITAQSIEVRGEVNGAIKGANVTLHPTARVDGDILHQTLSIAEGARFDGRVRRPKDPAEIAPNLDVAKLAATQPAAE